MSKPPVFIYTPEQISKIAGAAINDFETRLKVITSLAPEKRTFDNTVAAFDQALNLLGEAETVPVFLAYVSADAEVRKAAQALELRMSQYAVDIFSREDIFAAIKGCADTAPSLDEVRRRLLDKTLLDFKKNGLGLPARRKNLVKRLMKELIELEQKFSINLRNVSDAVEMTEGEMRGLPEDYKTGLKRVGPGGYLVTMNYPDVIPFMDNAEDDGARRKLDFAFNNRCAAENTPLMERAIELRRKIARLIGYKTYAAYALDDRMAKTPEAVAEFLERTRKKLVRKGRKELRDLEKLKEKKGGPAGPLAGWQWRYYNNLMRKETYSIDHEAIKKYLPLETVLKGMFSLFGRLFGARFEPVVLETWHPEVRAYEVKDAAGELIAHFYLDLFPRDGKYKHAACFGTRKGRRPEDGSWQTPAAAIVANFPSPVGEAPSLLKFDDMVTLFHEFGHVTHNIFTKSEFGRFSGTAVSRDFVEVPSKMLENWAYLPEALREVSGLADNPGEKLPDAVIEKLIAAKNMDSGMSYLRQIFFSALDMRYHTKGGKVDTTGIYAKLKSRISLMPMSEGTHPQASFGHLMGGYEAGYYSYLWSEALAADLFSVFEKAGAMDAATGARYREMILAPGRSLDELGQVKEFLGRDPGEEAFIKSIGG